jgi:phosphate-selective porin OprO/OprP
MRLNRTVGLLAGTTALSLGGICAANGGADTDALAQIAELKAELAAMRAQQGDSWLTEQRSTQIRGIVHDVLADAETRSSFQATGATAGYNANRGFFMSSPDGSFSMNVQGLVQARWTFNYANGEDRASEWGFDVRRARLTFSGKIAGDWSYEIQGQWGSPFGFENREVILADESSFEVDGAGGSFNLLNAYVQRDIELAGNTMTVTAGQFKAPFLREWLVDAGSLLSTDYSLLSYYFYQGYSVGVQLGMTSDDFRFNVAYTNGVGTPVDLGIGSYGSGWTNNPTQYSFAGRAEFKMGGNWSDFDTFSSRRGSAEGLMFGVAGLWQRYWDNLVTDDPAMVAGVTADVTWNFGGASLFAALVYENISTPNGSTQPWGFMVQGGYFLTDDVELFARYDYANSGLQAKEIGGGSTTINVVTLGANYFMSNNAKFTANFGYAFNQLGSLYAAQSAGFRPSSQNGQFAIQAQLQLTF